MSHSMELYFKSYTERKYFQFSTSERLSENKNWGEILLIFLSVSVELIYF